jgi:hypothetical protein
VKAAIIGFLVNRFAEHSSAVGVAAIITGGWQLYEALTASTMDASAVTAALTAVVFGVVAFITKDGRVLDTLKSLRAPK